MLYLGISCAESQMLGQPLHPRFTGVFIQAMRTAIEHHFLGFIGGVEKFFCLLVGDMKVVFAELEKDRRGRSITDVMLGIKNGDVFEALG